MSFLFIYVFIELLGFLQIRQKFFIKIVSGVVINFNGDSMFIFDIEFIDIGSSLLFFPQIKLNFFS